MKQTLLFVLGMHRSGTSAVTHAIHQMGATLGGAMVPSGFDNPKGFWENAQFVAYNNQIFNAFDLHWDATVPLPENWLSDKKIQDLKAEASSWLKRSFDDTALGVLKDPRACRTFSFWLEAARDAGFEVCALHILRPAAQIAQSFHVRDHSALEKGLFLFAFHELEAEKATRNIPRQVLHFEDLFSAPESCVEKLYALPIPWPHSKEEAVKKFTSVIEPGLRHQSSASLPTHVDKELRALIEQIEALLEKWRISKNAQIDKENAGKLYAQTCDMVNSARTKFDFWHAESMRYHAALLETHARNLTIQEMSDTVKSQESQIVNHRMHAQHLEGSKNQLEQELQQVYNSLSWKVTEPLRFIRKKFFKK